MTERATEAQCITTIVDAAKLLGWRVHHSRPGYTRQGYRTPIQGHKGLPDLILVRGRQLWIVETKRRPNKVEPEQQAWLDAFTAAGVAARVVWVPEGLAEFLADLARRPMKPAA